jgi:hypothetical protein
MFASIEQIERFLSPLGVMLFSDHDYTGTRDEDVIWDCIGRASAELVGLLYPLYPIEELEQSGLVSDWCVVMASYYLCLRRGNPVPDSLANEFDRIMGDSGYVERSKKGSFLIPGIKASDINAPAISNYRIDRRWINRTARVVRQTSTNIESQLPRDFARNRRWY